MFTRRPLNELAERRRLLLMESELHRSVIGLECENLRARLAGLNEKRERLAKKSSWLVAGGTVAGLLALRHWRKAARWIPSALIALRWVKSLKRS